MKKIIVYSVNRMFLATAIYALLGTPLATAEPGFADEGIQVESAVAQSDQEGALLHKANEICYGRDHTGGRLCYTGNTQEVMETCMSKGNSRFACWRSRAY